MCRPMSSSLSLVRGLHPLEQRGQRYGGQLVGGVGVLLLAVDVKGGIWQTEGVQQVIKHLAVCLNIQTAALRGAKDLTVGAGANLPVYNGLYLWGDRDGAVFSRRTFWRRQQKHCLARS